jgi:hypothetical protein
LEKGEGFAKNYGLKKKRKIRSNQIEEVKIYQKSIKKNR